MEIRWSLPAAEDLERICERIERDNPDAARRVAKTIYDACGRLKDFPNIGRASSRMSGRRELTFAPLPYIVVYQVKENAVEVSRIFHRCAGLALTAAKLLNDFQAGSNAYTGVKQITVPFMSDLEPRATTLGLRIVRSGELDSNTPQTPGMTRAEAISYARVGAQKLWAGTVVVHPNAKTGPHHHGELETVIYIVRGRARFRWGAHLEFVDEAGPGDFVYVPPFAPHQELNARKDQPVEAVIVRSGQEPVVVNLDIPSPENETDTLGADPFHSTPE